MEEVLVQAPESDKTGEAQAMHTPEDVSAMLKLASLGWGAKRIAKELGCSRNTVRRYVRGGGYMAYRTPQRAGQLEGLKEWIAVRYVQHRGNADVVRQDLQRERRVVVSLRTVERAVAHLRREVPATNGHSEMSAADAITPRSSRRMTAPSKLPNATGFDGQI
jgi:Homeodomain-like domain